MVISNMSVNLSASSANYNINSNTVHCSLDKKKCSKYRDILECSCKELNGIKEYKLWQVMQDFHFLYTIQLEKYFKKIYQIIES